MRSFLCFLAAVYLGSNRFWLLGVDDIVFLGICGLWKASLIVVVI